MVCSGSVPDSDSVCGSAVVVSVVVTTVVSAVTAVVNVVVAAAVVWAVVTEVVGLVVVVVILCSADDMLSLSEEDVTSVQPKRITQRQ